ncbi:PDDEXK family nuclease [Methanosarcina mazei]|uniref:Uncharacterized protein n=1 Tax=Methanosarcina mazei TaxID=2209 RepID=A0A4V1FAV0_METMZ|nr:hypothetical protein [Methanosarcina mazei]QCR16573.1 hypothetical protein DKM28_11640 [Methanosarcina mazei]
MEIKPIETQYNGYRFRSRLEARWAVFFDSLGIIYEYEKEGYDLGFNNITNETVYYLPDFYLPKYKYWVEIKSTKGLNDKELVKLEKFSLKLTNNSNLGTLIVLMGEPYVGKYIAESVLRGSMWGICPLTEKLDLYKPGSWPGEETIDCNECKSKCSLYHNSSGGENKNEMYQGGLCFSKKPFSIFKHPNIIKAYQAARSARFEFGESGQITEKKDIKPLTEFELFKYRYFMRANGYLMEEICNSIKNDSPSEIRERFESLPIIPEIQITEKDFIEYNIYRKYKHKVGYTIKPQNRIKQIERRFDLNEWLFLLGTVNEDTIAVDKLKKQKAEANKKRYPFIYARVDEKEED